MKAFYFKNHAGNPLLQKIISAFFDDNFNQLSLVQVQFLLRTLDDYIFVLTGQPTIKIIIDTESKKNYRGHYSHNYDGYSFKNETMEIIAKDRTLSGVDYLIIYLHEKFHQFQFHSVIENNKDISETTLQIWKWCAEYTDGLKGTSTYEEYLANPIERDAYRYQYDQILDLTELYLDKKKQKKAKKELKRLQIATWVDNDINHDNEGLTYIIIQNAKREFSPEDIFYRKKRV